MNKSFTLVEILIVVAILGILAAIALPQFQSYAQQAKEAAAKANLRILRSAIELYATEHDGVAPGYKDNDPEGQVDYFYFHIQMIQNRTYLPSLPENPLNGSIIMEVLDNDENFPEEPEAEKAHYGWIYKPSTKTIKLYSAGTDSDGIAYYDY